MTSAPPLNPAETYTGEFYDYQSSGSLRSARTVVPLLLQWIPARRVVDVGCGVGTWLKAFDDNGVPEVQGFDGAYVDKSKLVIDPSCFAACDLFGEYQLDGNYDLAVCLEVGEHLPHRASCRLVAELTRVAPLVLFSAAIPGQQGTGHINEQWPTYWRGLFASHGFSRLDVLRGHILHDKRVEWWYRQNMYLYASERGLAEAPALRTEAARVSSVSFMCIEEGIFARYTSFGGLLSLLPGAAWRALRRRFRSGS
jgi:hypothetical protein